MKLILNYLFVDLSDKPVPNSVDLVTKMTIRRLYILIGKACSGDDFNNTIDSFNIGVDSLDR